MDSDANITSLLHRLGGVYRDPQRVDRDGSRLLRSPLGAHLKPATSPLVQDNGEITPPVLVFNGTVAMSYRGSTYNIPVDVYLPPPYPIRPPVVFVRPTTTMVVKPNHPHVATDGKVYMPYLSEWRPHSHTLVEMSVCLSSLFGSNPPVYARPAGTPAPPPNPVHSFGGSAAPAPAPPSFSNTATSFMQGVFNPSRSQQQQQQTPPRYQDLASSNNGSSNNRQKDDDDDDDFRRTMAASKAEAERVEAARAADAVRQAEQAQQAEKRRKVQADVRTTQEARDQLTSKLQGRLQQFYNGSRESISSDLRDQTRLERGSENIALEITDLRKQKDLLMEGTDHVEDATVRITEFVRHMESNPEIDVDDLVRPADVHSAQMLDLSAQNASIDDALYYLDRGLVKGTVKLDVHLKAVRRLAKRQFLARAHLMKIGQAKAHAGKDSMYTMAPSF